MLLQSYSCDINEKHSRSEPDTLGPVSTPENHYDVTSDIYRSILPNLNTQMKLYSKCNCNKFFFEKN